MSYLKHNHRFEDKFIIEEDNELDKYIDNAIFDEKKRITPS